MANQRSLTAITVEESQRAVEAANADQQLPDGKVVLLTEDRYKDALAFVQEFFLKDEPVDKACGVEWSKEVEDIWFLSAFKLNMSLVLINPEDDSIMAIRTTTVSKRGTDIDLDAIKDDNLREVFRIVGICNDQAKFHEHYDCDEAVHFLGLAVDRRYRKRGLANKLVKFQISFLKHLGIAPLFIKVEGSSNYSKRVFESLGFETLNEFIFDEYLVDGKRVLGDTGEHKSMKTYGYKVC